MFCNLEKLDALRASVKYLQSIFFIFLLFSPCVRCSFPTFHSESSHLLSENVQSWTHEVSFSSKGEGKIYWNANGVDWLTMEISAPTQGYVGVGFSPNGGMVGSDLVIGWVDDNDGSPHLHDYYGGGLKNGAPKIDPSQDYQLILAMQTANGTLIRFRRKWDTCDEEHDMAIIGEDTIRLIWAWSKADLAAEEIFHWHGPDNRGTRSTIMRSLQATRQFPDDVPIAGVQEWVTKVDNLHVPLKQTVYHCKIVKLPNYEKKQHIIGYRAIIQKENLPFVHHITLYSCKVPSIIGDTAEVFEKYLNYTGGDCLTGDVPSDWTKFCYEIMMLIGIGGEGDMFPENVGLPFISNENGESNYIRFEIHYDNPGLKRIVDSSGMKIFHTDKLRDEDIGMIFLGNKVTPFHLIPQNLKKFTTFSFCPGSCTKTALLKSGVKISGLLLHAHAAATAIRLRHIRSGKELPPIAVDNHYDFNYQQFRTLSKEVRLLPGDDLLIECDYNSLGHNDTILGGFPSRREMCQVALWVHPKVETLTDCRTQVEFYSFFKTLGIETVEDPIFETLKLPYVPKSFSEEEWKVVPPDDTLTILHHYPQYQQIESNIWKDIKGFPYKKRQQRQINVDGNTISINSAILKKSSSMQAAELLQDIWRNGSFYVYCAGNGGRRIENREIIQPYPSFEEYDFANERKSRSECSEISRSNSINSFNNALFLLIISLVNILNLALYT